jgi:hypothetical protein
MGAVLLDNIVKKINIKRRSILGKLKPVHIIIFFFCLGPFKIIFAIDQNSYRFPKV